ncbi:MAG: Bug family tripartite tricarboxylate transporter substrate binding protein [Xanthobacteraceae bacterium]
MRSQPSLRVLLTCLALAAASPAQSQEWPQKPVRIVVSFAAGGNSDIVARLIGQRLSEAFAQQFVIENRPGASGAIAAEAVARAPADGYTLLMGNVPVISITPALGKVSYDPVKDFAPISAVGANPLVLVAHPSVPVANIEEFVGYARGRPRQLTYVSSGAGSIVHLAMALFLKRAELEMTPVSYKGGAAPLTDVIAGHVKTYFSNLSVVMPHVNSGALRMLGVTAERRVAAIPHVPTFIESGFPRFRILTWNGLMAPAGTPGWMIDRMAKEVARAVQDPKFVERLANDGFDPIGNRPNEFAAMIAEDISFWAEAVKIAGMQDR